jgi:hypothetical protein
MEYTVVLIDKDGCNTANDLVEGLRSAKKRAAYLLSYAFATSVGSTHEMLGTQKVEVRNEAGDCLWDAFLPQAAPTISF